MAWPPPTWYLIVGACDSPMNRRYPVSDHSPAVGGAPKAGQQIPQFIEGTLESTVRTVRVLLTAALFYMRAAFDQNTITWESLSSNRCPRRERRCHSWERSTELNAKLAATGA